jgi:hypothetical protein
VRRLRLRPVFGFFLREYNRYSPDFSFRVMLGRTPGNPVGTGSACGESSPEIDLPRTVGLRATFSTGSDNTKNTVWPAVLNFVHSYTAATVRFVCLDLMDARLAIGGFAAVAFLAQRRV